MTPEEAKVLVAGTDWYHGWETLPGVHTGGKSSTDPKRVLDRYGVPERLDGLRALDIGAWDGPYSFELERRGATVTSADIQDPDSTAYNTAKRILDSKCEYAQCSVYNLDPERMGQFDIVLHLGVFYHLRHPMAAWNRIRRVMKPDATLFFEGAVFDYTWKVDAQFKDEQAQIEAIRDLPITHFAAGKYASCWSNWCIPTKACVHDWLVAAGFCVLDMSSIEQYSRVYGNVTIDAEANLAEHGMSSANAEPKGAQDPEFKPAL